MYTYIVRFTGTIMMMVMLNTDKRSSNVFQCVWSYAFHWQSVFFKDKIKTAQNIAFVNNIFCTISTQYTHMYLCIKYGDFCEFFIAMWRRQKWRRRAIYIYIYRFWLPFSIFFIFFYFYLCFVIHLLAAAATAKKKKKK